MSLSPFIIPSRDVSMHEAKAKCSCHVHLFKSGCGRRCYSELKQGRCNLVIPNSCNWAWPFQGEGEIIAYERTSHPSNIETWPPISWLLIDLKWIELGQFGVFKINSGVRSTKKRKFHTNTISRLLCWMNEMYAHMR